MAPATLSEAAVIGKIEVIIIEDDPGIAEKYEEYLSQKCDPQKKVISKIITFNNDEAFIAYDSPPSKNRIYIVDLILDENNISRGERMGKAVMRHLIESGGENPVFIRSGNLYVRDFEIPDNPRFIKVEKGPTRNNFLIDVFEKAKTYFASLKEFVVHLYIEECMDSKGTPFLQEASIDENFNDYYINGSRDMRDALFIAKCFVTTPMPLNKSGTTVWETEHATWVVRTQNTEGEDDRARPVYLRKFYSASTKRLHKIRLEDKSIEVYFDSVKSFIQLMSVLKSTEVSHLDNLIICHYIVYRCVDLYSENKLSADIVISLLREHGAFGLNQAIYEKMFIVSLWEKHMLTPGNNMQLVNEKLAIFYTNKFPFVQDIFYCQVNEEPDSENDYVSAEVRSVDAPSHTFIRQYQKNYIQNIKPLENLKTFKLVYYQPPGAVGENSCTVDNVLIEEFIFLGLDKK